MNWQETLGFLGQCLPPQAVKHLRTVKEGSLREIRVRAGRRIRLETGEGSVCCPVTPSQQQVNQIAEALSEHALYARAEEMRSGFVTLRGGHRMGLCGRVICQGQLVRGLRDISSLCVRIAGQWPGAADRLMPFLTDREGRVLSALIIGLPGSGKTTMLRDALRRISEAGKRVCVVDERSEIAAMCEGEPQLDVGPNTDVLDGCAKDAGLRWMVRAMSPEVLATDELRDMAEGQAVLEAVQSGITVLATAHGRDTERTLHRGTLSGLAANGAFERYVLLRGDCVGEIEAVYDEELRPLSREREA